MFANANDTTRSGRCGHGPGHHAEHHAEHHDGHRHGPHRHGFGGPGGLFGEFTRGGGPRGRGRKARRGDIRTAALLLLAEEPRNGYQIMQEVQERSDGLWSPSPGSVYPALAQLEDEGLIRSDEIEGRKLFALTDAGSAHLQERGTDKPAPWEQLNDDFGSKGMEIRKVVGDTMSAFTQVMRSGDEEQMRAALKVLVQARRDLYRILADADSEAIDSDS
jgi:DNA-binding PadR family transcriptional regulator